MAIKKISLRPNDFITGIGASSNNISRGVFERAFSTGFDIFDGRRDYGSIKPGPAKQDKSTNISDNVKYLVNYGTGIYGFGDAGYLYKQTSITGTPAVLDSGNEGNRDGDGTQGGKGLCVYNQGGTDYLFYSYNDDIGRFDFSSTFVDSYWKTTLSAAALEATPHPMVVFGETLWIANGSKVASLENTTAATDALELPSYYEIQDLDIYNNYLAVLAIDSRGSTFSTKSRLFLWDTYSDSFNYEFEIDDYCTALDKYKNDLVLFGGYVRLFNNGNYQIIDEADATILPGQTYSKDSSVFWQESGKIMGFGSPNQNIQACLQTPITGCGSNGAILPSINSYASFIVTNESDEWLQYESGNSGGTVRFNAIHFNNPVYIKAITFYFAKLTTNDGATVQIYDDNLESIFSDTITYANDGALRMKRFKNITPTLVESIQPGLSWSGYTSGTLEFRGIDIEYETTTGRI